MIEYEVHAAGENLRRERDQITSGALHFNLPFQPRDIGEMRLPPRVRDLRQRPADEIEPQPHDTGVIELDELGGADCRLDDGDAAHPPARGAECLGEIRIIRAEKTRLHDDAVGHAIGVELAEIIRDPRVIIGGITDILRALQTVVEDMRMRVDGELIRRQRGCGGHCAYGGESHAKTPARQNRRTV